MSTLTGPPLDEVGALTVGGFLAEVCERHADRDALVLEDTRWTYADLWREVQTLARALVAAGATRGTRVGVLMGNRPEAVAAFFAAPLIGGVVVPLSTFSPKPELEFLLRDAYISILLTQTTLLQRHFERDVEEIGPLPFLTTVAAVGGESWARFISGAGCVPQDVVDGRAAGVHPSDDGLIIYSSGTTDRPKGMLHHHRAPTVAFWLQARLFRRDESTRMWTALPMFWTAGINTAMGATLAAGGCWVMQETFEPGAALALMARERVTEPYALPHQTAALAEHPDWTTTDLSSLRCVFGKSAFARHPSVTNGDTTWQMPVGYGLSETCAFFIAHPWNAGRERMKESMGRLLPGNELRIVDPTSGAVLGAGADGELAIRGPSLMEHYVKKTREECFDGDGFFHTGDVGFYDADGYVHWTGRRTEMIKTGGANVSPAEIEVQLRAFSPVKLARVLGVPDPRLDQLVVLCVTLREGAAATEDEIKAFLRGRVASYKVPKRVLFFEEGEIPMTESATKVRDAELRALVERRLSEVGASE